MNQPSASAVEQTPRQESPLGGRGFRPLRPALVLLASLLSLAALTGGYTFWTAHASQTGTILRLGASATESDDVRVRIRSRAADDATPPEWYPAMVVVGDQSPGSFEPVAAVEPVAAAVQPPEEAAEVEASDDVPEAPRLAVVVGENHPLIPPPQVFPSPALSIALRPASPSLVAEHLPETQGLETPDTPATPVEYPRMLLLGDRTSVVMRGQPEPSPAADIRMAPAGEPTPAPAESSSAEPQVAAHSPAPESEHGVIEEAPWVEPEESLAQNSTPAAVPSPAPAEEVQSPSPVFDLDNRPIGSVTANIGHSQGDLPQDLAKARLSAMRDRPYNLLIDREWEPICYLWDAPALRHQPLYFEEVNLERYGYRWPIVGAAQPVCSALHFYGTLPLLPYKMWSEPYNERIYTLGHYRPGSPVPYQTHWPRWRPGAFSFEAAVATGVVFLLP